MAGTRRILEIYVRTLQVEETGDRKHPAAQNALLALLLYPLPGKAEVLATTGLLPGLIDGQPLHFEPPRILLKEFVQGPTDLLLTLTDRDDRNRLVTILRRMGSALVGSAGDVAERWVPGLLRTAFQEAVASGRLAIGSQNEDKIEVVGVGALAIREPENAAGRYSVTLTTPVELGRAHATPIAAGDPNGRVDLEIVVREP
jgi:hypothetical protein